jgi:hypothetical protein
VVSASISPPLNPRSRESTSSWDSILFTTKLLD